MAKVSTFTLTKITYMDDALEMFIIYRQTADLRRVVIRTLIIFITTLLAFYLAFALPQFGIPFGISLFSFAIPISALILHTRLFPNHHGFELHLSNEKFVIYKVRGKDKRGGAKKKILYEGPNQDIIQMKKGKLDQFSKTKLKIYLKEFVVPATWKKGPFKSIEEEIVENDIGGTLFLDSVNNSLILKPITLEDSTLAHRVPSLGEPLDLQYND